MAAITAVTLQLAVDSDAVALTAVERAPPPTAITAPATLADKIQAQLAAAAEPLSATVLRKLCSVRNASLNSALADLVAAGRVRKDATGYVVAR